MSFAINDNLVIVSKPLALSHIRMSGSNTYDWLEGGHPAILPTE